MLPQRHRLRKQDVVPIDVEQFEVLRHGKSRDHQIYQRDCQPLASRPCPQFGCRLPRLGLHMKAGKDREKLGQQSALRRRTREDPSGRRTSIHAEVSTTTGRETGSLSADRVVVTIPSRWSRLAAQPLQVLLTQIEVERPQ